MTPSRWEHVFAIFDAALAMPAVDREAFLARECRGDAQTREDVESLLAAHHDATGFLSGPVGLHDAMRSHRPHTTARVLPAGTRIGAFEIETLAGAGGMGQVYGARDTRLDRRVALKILPAAGAADPRARARFAYEARAIARLSHPHICALYDLGHDDGVDFLVMEYLDGEPLDVRLRRGPLSLDATLRFSIEVAGALEAAHAEGIVHSDLKPANIMLVRSGPVGQAHVSAKLLDFGLARFQRASPAAAPERVDADTPGASRPGLIAGTLPYMAPEQMRGNDPDPRSDIFSLGCVMYEMVAGRAPFAGDTSHDVLSAILDPDVAAPPLSDVPSRVHGEANRRVETVIRRCLDKAPDRRFAHAGDLRAELETIATQVADAARPRTGRWLTGVVVLAALVIVAAGLSGLRDDPPAPSRGAPTRVVPLTALNGQEQQPAISPDGTRVAFAWNGEREDNLDIYVKAVDSSDLRRLTSAAAPEYLPAWSPDGRSIAFLRDHPVSGAVVHAVDVITGVERLLTDVRLGSGGSARLAWAPDGRAIVGRLDAAQERATVAYSALQLIPLGGGRPTRLADTRIPDIDVAPAFSPDGRRLAYAHCSGVPRTCAVETIELGPGFRPVGRTRRLAMAGLVGGIAWTRDGLSVVYDSNARGPWELWRTSADGGAAPERLEIPGEHARLPAIAAAGDRLAFERPIEQINVFDVAQPRPPEPVLVSPTWDRSPRFSPDGQRLAFSSRRAGGVEEIWLAAADGSEARQLTRGPGRRQALPSWSPDGRHVAFESTSANAGIDIWVIEAAGGTARRVTTDPGDERAPTWSRDGTRIYFVSARAGDALPWGDTWQVPVAGGPPTRVTHGGSAPLITESADGGAIFYQRPVLYQAAAPRPFAYRTLGDTPLMMQPAGGAPRELVPCVKALSFTIIGSELYFSPCGSRRYRNRDSGAVETWQAGDPIPIQAMDIVTGRVRTIATVRSPFDPGRLAVSPDGRRVLVHRSVQASDLMLIEDFR